MMMNVCSVPALAAEGEDDSSDDSESTAAAVVNVETQELGNDGKSVTTTYEDGTVEVVTTAHDEEGNTYTYNSSTLTTETQDPPKREESFDRHRHNQHERKRFDHQDRFGRK
jgi:hypothetical protein